MSHLQVALQISGQFAQVLLEPVLPMSVATSAVAQQQARGKPVMPVSKPPPPKTKGVARQLTGVGAARQVQESLVAPRIVHAVGFQPLSVIYTQVGRSFSGPKAIHARAKSSMRRMPIQSGCGPGGASAARL